MPMSATVQHLSPRGKLMLCAHCTAELHILQLSKCSDHGHCAQHAVLKNHSMWCCTSRLRACLKHKQMLLTWQGRGQLPTLWSPALEMKAASSICPTLNPLSMSNPLRLMNTWSSSLMHTLMLTGIVLYLSVLKGSSSMAPNAPK